MNKLFPLPHGRSRLQQRGFRLGDAELIRALGVEMGPGEFFVPDGVVTREIHRRQRAINAANREVHARSSVHRTIAGLKREIHRLERVRNRRVVVDGDVLITAYPMTSAERRRGLRRVCSRDISLLRGPTRRRHRR
jgi:hypothetical protein